MKKLILSLAVLGVMAVAACSSDDNETTGTDNCMNCENIIVCEGGNGNAYVNDTDTGTDYEEYLHSFFDADTDCTSVENPDNTGN